MEILSIILQSFNSNFFLQTKNSHLPGKQVRDRMALLNDLKTQTITFHQEILLLKLQDLVLR